MICVQIVGGSSFSGPATSRRQAAQHLIRDFAVLGRHDVLSLRQTIGSKHFVAEFAQATQRPAVRAATPGRLRKSSFKIEG